MSVNKIQIYVSDIKHLIHFGFSKQSLTCLAASIRSILTPGPIFPPPISPSQSPMLTKREGRQQHYWENEDLWLTSWLANEERHASNLSATLTIGGFLPLGRTEQFTAYLILWLWWNQGKMDQICERLRAKKYHLELEIAFTRDNKSPYV